MNIEQQEVSARGYDHWKRFVATVVQKQKRDWRKKKYAWSTREDPMCFYYFNLKEKACAMDCPFVVHDRGCFDDDSPMDLIRLAKDFGNSVEFKAAVSNYIAHLRFFCGKDDQIPPKIATWARRVFEKLAAADIRHEFPKEKSDDH